MKSEFKVGQKVWYVPFRLNKRYDGEEVTITKVGREWAHFGNKQRFSLEPSHLNGSHPMGDIAGYTDNGSVWPSRAAYTV